MDSILDDTKKLFVKLSDKKGVVNKMKRFVKAGCDEEEISVIKERLILLSQAATYMSLVK